MSKLNSKWLKIGSNYGNYEVGGSSLPASYTPTNYIPVETLTEPTDRISAHFKGLDNKLNDIHLGPEDKKPTTFSFSNNQTTPTNVTSLIFSSIITSYVNLVINVIIQTDIDSDPEYSELFIIDVNRSNNAWNYTIKTMGDNSGVNFSITSSGQVQYTSSNISGFISGQFSFKCETLGT